jgi:ABC-type multidrug transport system fused ATPase/permease subunit
MGAERRSMKFFKKSILQDSLSLLPRETPKRLILLVLLQVSVSTLDIVAIVLLGLTSKLSIDYVQNKNVSWPETLTRFLGINDLDFEIQAGFISAFIVGLFSARTVISIYSNKRILLYLANQASYASKRIMERIFRSKPQAVIARNSQKFLYGITSGIDSLTLSYLGSLTVFITEIFFLATILCVVFVIEPITGLVALLIFALASFGISKITAERAKKCSSENSNLSIFYNRRILDTLLVYRELYLRKSEISVAKEVQIARTNSLMLRAQLMTLPTLSKYLFELTLILGGATTALIQILLTDALTAISSVAIFLAAASRILPSLIRAQGAFISIRQSEGSSEITIKQLRDLEMEEESNSKRIENVNEISKFVPNLKISNLDFTHPGQSQFTLESINFEVSAGQFVAIVGKSGAGKTTLIDLILGMLTPESGTVEISNTSPFMAIRNWPGKVAYVPQDIMIIDGDIRRNIALEETHEISDEEIFVALEKSYLKYDVLKMKNGLNEIVGERGIRLSGGQRQRLGIARALYTKPEMIIFDEATSSLDPMTEKTVTEAIYEKKGNVTLIVVAHRLSTVKNADLVILLDKGKIVAKGTFEEVRNISPEFDQQAKLVNL